VNRLDGDQFQVEDCRDASDGRGGILFWTNCHGCAARLDRVEVERLRDWAASWLGEIEETP
jgi:hypothetical protein